MTSEAKFVFTLLHSLPPPPLSDIDAPTPKILVDKNWRGRAREGAGRGSRLRRGKRGAKQAARDRHYHNSFFPLSLFFLPFSPSSKKKPHGRPRSLQGRRPLLDGRPGGRMLLALRRRRRLLLAVGVVGDADRRRSSRAACPPGPALRPPRHHAGPRHAPGLCRRQRLQGRPPGGRGRHRPAAGAPAQDAALHLAARPLRHRQRQGRRRRPVALQHGRTGERRDECGRRSVAKGGIMRGEETARARERGTGRERRRPIAMGGATIGGTIYLSPPSLSLDFDPFSR